MITVALISYKIWADHLARMGERRGAYRILVGNLERKRPFGRPKLKWRIKLKMDLQDVGWGAWTGCASLRIGTGGGLL
jgi:hypothetical protein